MKLGTQKTVTLTDVGASTSGASSLATSVSETVNIEFSDKHAFHVLIEDTRPADVVFTDSDVTVATDTIASTAHGLHTGLEVQLSSSGTLPTGISTSTSYWVIAVDADNFQLASSLANAIAGTDITISGASGGGNHTLSAEANAVTVQVQESNDNINFADVNSASATTNNSLIKNNLHSRYVRFEATPTAGKVDITVITNGKP